MLRSHGKRKFLSSVIVAVLGLRVWANRVQISWWLSVPTSALNVYKMNNQSHHGRGNYDSYAKFLCKCAIVCLIHPPLVDFIRRWSWVTTCIPLHNAVDFSHHSPHPASNHPPNASECCWTSSCHQEWPEFACGDVCTRRHCFCFRHHSWRGQQTFNCQFLSSHCTSRSS